MTHRLAEAIAKAIPKCFAESIHEVIEKSVEKSLSDVVSRSVTEGVEKAIHPLVEELPSCEKHSRKTWTTIGGRATRRTNQTTSPRTTPSSDLATALAEDRVPWVCRSAGLLRLPLAIEHGRKSGHRRKKNFPHENGESEAQTILSRRHPASTNADKNRKQSLPAIVFHVFRTDGYIRHRVFKACSLVLVRFVLVSRQGPATRCPRQTGASP